MNKYKIHLPLIATLSILFASASLAQTTNNPFPTPIPAETDVILVKAQNFATIPNENNQAPRLMLLLDEPGTQRLFVSAMTGKLYSLSYDGTKVELYVDINDPKWKVAVQSGGSERGLQSFAFHPQFNQAGTPGYGKFYTYTDTSNMQPKADFVPEGSDRRSHDTVLLEWTAKNAAAATYDGGEPKELLRAAQPYFNHNGGQIAFNPLANSDSEDFGLLYIGLADGGSGGDPMGLAQNLKSGFGKILRINPVGDNSSNKKYGIPSSNPFVNNGEALPEIYAYGVRNPQRFSWDAKTGAMILAEIGQNAVEEISIITAGGNLGWNKWEGSYKFDRLVNPNNPRSESGLIYPIVEYDHDDPLLQRQTAITGVYVLRKSPVPQLNNLLIFGDNPTGEIFYVNADKLPNGGQDSIRRILFSDGGKQKTLLQLINENASASRADMRMGIGSDDRLYILNKHDGIVRALAPL